MFLYFLCTLLFYSKVKLEDESGIVILRPDMIN